MSNRKNGAINLACVGEGIPFGPWEKWVMTRTCAVLVPLVALLGLGSVRADDAGKPRNKSGVVRITIARLVAPNGTAINGVGIAPDFLVSDPARQWEVALERAIELIQPMRSPSLMVLPPSQ